MNFDGKIINFNIYDDIKYPSDVSCVYGVDTIESLNQKHFDSRYDYKLNIVISNNFDVDSLKILGEDFIVEENL